MADNVVLNAGTGGVTLATDDITNVHYQRVKLVDGTLDATTAIAAGGGVEAGALRVTVASDSTGVLSVDDNGGALTVDGTVTANAGTGPWPVTDNAGSLTVDGTVSITGTVTVDSELTTADLDTGAGTDTRAVVGLVGSASGGGALIPGSATDGLLVNLGANNDVTVTGTVTANLAAGTNNIGDVDVLSLPALAAGTNNIGDVDVLTLPALVAGTANIGDVDVLTIAAGDNNIGNVDIVTMPNVTLAAGTNTNEVVGDVAHDAAVAGNPVLVAARANANEPATAVADGDATHLWADLFGRLVVLPGHPSPEAPVTANGSAAGVSVIAAPGASVSLYICKGSVHNSAAAEQVISLRDGAAGTVRWTINAAADGGGSTFDFGARGWKLTANTALVMDAAAATAYCNITEYYIAA